MSIHVRYLLGIHLSWSLPAFYGKTLANCSGFAKSPKVFPHYRFALYGSTISTTKLTATKYQRYLYHSIKIVTKSNYENYENLKLYGIFKQQY